MSTPSYVAVNGLRTRVRVAGDADNPPVLLLHGIGRSLEDWAPQYRRLGGTHRVIAVDLPGFGFSARPHESMTLAVLARGVADLLDTLGERRPIHVIGNSLGGAVALQLLAFRPERVASLVLVNSAAFGSQVSALLRLLALPRLGRLATRRTTRAAARLTERAIFTDRSLATRERIDHALAIARQPDRGIVMHETARALATGRGVRPEWRAELMAEVAAHPRPTLIVWGDRDRILPAHHLAAAGRLIPHAETFLFAGIGHMPQIECPDEFAELVLNFLATATTRGPHPTPAAADLDALAQTAET
ncbi:alpha/beta fold hydrolase [Nocardia lijiangensis]|uniref:alpha/beta fold hydrolase n=1 Tax=Nocardia lijiangensis TaxID=299618 RepID=UPI003D721589